MPTDTTPQSGVCDACGERSLQAKHCAGSSVRPLAYFTENFGPNWHERLWPMSHMDQQEAEKNRVILKAVLLLRTGMSPEELALLHDDMRCSLGHDLSDALADWLKSLPR